MDFKRLPLGGKPSSTYIAWPAGHLRRRRLRRAAIGIVILTVGLALVGWDMRRRGIPLTWHGLRWWASLWLQP
jgi:hypothetical protein